MTPTWTVRPPRPRGVLPTVLALTGVLACTTAGAVEPWADRSLAVTDGLVLWLDAARQGTARAADGLPPLAPGAAVAVWYDGSGRGARLIQRWKFAQPTFLATGGRAAVRFDGKDDHLAGPVTVRPAGAFTAFVVAAPHANPGGFSALLAANAPGRSDFTTGFTLDLGQFPGGRFETLNVEGAGFVGALDLMTAVLPFGPFHVIEARAQPGPDGVELVIDGAPQGRRSRDPGPLRLDEVSVGGRYYTIDSEPPFARGFFDGEIAEVLLYDRALSDPERLAVRRYLHAKHFGASGALSGTPLKSVADPPPVQVLAPGFEVERLPLKLANINNVRYRPDGALVALAYDGNVYLLTDRDGDGLEDHAALFFANRGSLRAPIGMALTPPGYRPGNGLFVACKGKCSLIVDTDGDDRADREIVVASGWQELPHGVDALGVALGHDGSVYFGLGAADYTNPYQRDPSGRARYDLHSDRGTIQRVAPDFSTREAVATGVRFPVGLAFNRLGDLFATDQEGATWLPNGNPFDELLHIERGRHYGFPPRHSKFLQGVIDEPSVFDYGPQHQSTCGLSFNEPVKQGGPTFGPEGWAGDALVSGYSRGKLYRTTLAKTSAGYVARNVLLACLSMLSVDSCVAPDGALVVAAHSGGPDWGSGPNGSGALFKIRYADRSLAQPVAAWAASPREVRVAFDRPLAPDHLRGLAGGATLTSGPYVAAGDRFETLRPGYAAVAAQLAAPRSERKVRTVNVTPDRRTLVLAVDPLTDAVSYALTLPGLGRGTPRHGLPQHPAVDLAFDLSGAEASWRPADGGEGWSGWLPHLDPAASRAFTRGSADHGTLWPLLARPGILTLSATLDLRDMLRPAVQPGSKVDDVLPPEEVTLTFDVSGPIRVRVPDGKGGTVDATSTGRVEIPCRPQLGGLLPVRLALRTGSTEARLDVSWHTAEDPRPRALPLRRILVPWARSGAAPAAPETAAPAELAGGNWLRGRQVFFGETARCGQCHTIRGQGGAIGPDLSNLVFRDVASVLRDIREPNAAINPDFITYDVALADGRVLTGPVRTEGRALLVGDSQGKVTRVSRDEVEELKPEPVSAMPRGLADALGAARLKDLLTFLLTVPIEPAPIHREGAPPERTMKEVEAALQAVPDEAKARRPLKVVLVAGPKDHGVDEHDYPLWRERWAKLLGMAENVTVATADVWPSAEDFATADVLVWYSANPGWSAEKGPQLDAFLNRGGGMIYLHYAVNGRAAPEALAGRIGLAWRDGASKFRHGPLVLNAPKGARSPITAGLDGLRLVDESYWDLVGDPSRVDVLLTAVEDGRPRPLVWTSRRGRGRVFCSIPGHYSWTFDDPLFRLLVLRGLAWSAGEPPGRFHELATVGARVRGG